MIKLGDCRERPQFRWQARQEGTLVCGVVSCECVELFPQGLCVIACLPGNLCQTALPAELFRGAWRSCGKGVGQAFSFTECRTESCLLTVVVRAQFSDLSLQVRSLLNLLCLSLQGGNLCEQLGLLAGKVLAACAHRVQRLQALLHYTHVLLELVVFLRDLFAFGQEPHPLLPCCIDNGRFLFLPVAERPACSFRLQSAFPGVLQY